MSVVLGNVGNTEVIFVKRGEKGYPYEERVSSVFKAGFLDTFLLPLEKDKKVLLVGLGKENVKEPATSMEISAKACKELKKYEINEYSFNVENLKLNKESFVNFAKGIYLSIKAKRSYKTDVKKEKIKVGIKGTSLDIIPLLKKAEVVSDSIIFARDMVNAPSNYLHPKEFTEEIAQFVKDTAIETEILDEERLKKLKMGGILGVGGSSAFPPYLIVLRYRGNPKSKENTAIVGKGITVDTGGYCLKPSQFMAGIRGDNGGAAAVVGAIAILAKLKAKVNVTAIVPTAENKIAPDSYVDGDVLTSYSGRTIEVCDTDAEGRLILADAVTYAVRNEKATRVLDIATLTGAVVGMYGFTIGGVVTDSDEMWEEFCRASLKTGEKHARIPFGREHEKMLESDIADIKNLGGKFCGTITAGLFIRSFAEKKPWLHVDIAGTAWVDTPDYAYQDKYATGVCVDTIAEWLMG